MQEERSLRTVRPLRRISTATLAGWRSLTLATARRFGGRSARTRSARTRLAIFCPRRLGTDIGRAVVSYPEVTRMRAAPGQPARNSPSVVWVRSLRRGSSLLDATGARTWGSLVANTRAGLGRLSRGVVVGVLCWASDMPVVPIIAAPAVAQATATSLRRGRGRLAVIATP